jgi:hypothetical protein
MRKCVRGGGLYSFLLCVVLHVLFSKLFFFTGKTNMLNYQYALGILLVLRSNSITDLHIDCKNYFGCHVGFLFRMQ